MRHRHRVGQLNTTAPTCSTCKSSHMADGICGFVPQRPSDSSCARSRPRFAKSGREPTAVTKPLAPTDRRRFSLASTGQTTSPCDLRVQPGGKKPMVAMARLRHGSFSTARDHGLRAVAPPLSWPIAGSCRIGSAPMDSPSAGIHKRRIVPIVQAAMPAPIGKVTPVPPSPQ